MKEKVVLSSLNRCLESVFFGKKYEPYITKENTGWLKRNENGDLYFIELGCMPIKNIFGAASTSYKVDPYLIISIKEIEDYYRKVTQNKYLVKEIHFSTLSTNLASIKAFPDGIIRGIGHHRYDWIIHNENDVQEVANKLVSSISTIALPYIVTNSTVSRVDELLNNNLDKNIIHSTLWASRAMRGIIAGKLAGRPNLASVVKLYDEIIALNPERTKVEYIELKEILEL